VRRVDVDGIVVDGKGAGVAGAWVAVVRGRQGRDGYSSWAEVLESMKDPPAPHAETRADEQGRFRLNPPAGLADPIVATAPGYGYAQLTNLDFAEGAANVILRLRPDVLLRGRVENESGEPIEGATVRPWNEGAPLRRLAATTDASGRFELAVSEDPSFVAVYHPDYLGMLFKLAYGQPDRRVFVLEKGDALEGVVRHIDTREPLAGIELAVFSDGEKEAGPLPLWTQTGPDGRYRFERVPTQGHFSLYADGGSLGRLGTWPIPWDERWMVEEILLGEGSTATGRVVLRTDDGWEGVPGVRVTVGGYIGGSNLGRGKRATSGPDGTFKVEGIGLFPRAMLEPREIRFARVYHSDDQMVIGVVPAITVRGRVLDGEGEPVSGAWVRTSSSLGSGGGVFTGEDGAFVLRGVAPEARLLARKDGFAETRGVASGEAVELVLSRQQHRAPRGANSLWGMVVDRFGAPLLGVRVSIDGDPVLARRGRYEFSGLGDEEVTITAERSGFEVAQVGGVRAAPEGVEMPPIVLVEERAKVPEPPSGHLSIEGVVLHADGRPYVLAHIRCTQPVGEAFSFHSSLNGRFRITGLAPGSYRLESWALTPYYCDPVVVAAGTKEVVLQARLGLTIEGRVVGIQPGDGRFRVYATGETMRSARTDREGRFVIQGLPEGRYTVAIDRRGWLPEPQERIEAGTKDLELRALRLVGIRGKVVKPDGTPISGVSIRIASSSSYTNKEGRFAVEELRPGPYKIRAYRRSESGKKGTRAELHVHAPADDVVITLD
jgi:protocatechuate 3,4-dioxygenase beta subunit